jgi:hypothetical protein
MDYHDLQKKLFELDPTDPREDLAKLQAQASGQVPVSVPETVTTESIVESYEVPEGSLSVDKDYSISDFAALAGIKLTEAPQPAPQPASNAQLQKTGMGAKMVGNKLGAKGSAGMMGKALDKVAQGGALPANLAQQIAPFAKNLETILANPQLRQKFMMLVKQAEKAGQAEASEPKIKPRDPNAQYMNDLRKSGAMGAHKDKKKDSKAGKVKHKGKEYESIKDQLWAMLK